MDKKDTLTRDFPIRKNRKVRGWPNFADSPISNSKNGALITEAFNKAKLWRLSLLDNNQLLPTLMRGDPQQLTIMGRQE